MSFSTTAQRSASQYRAIAEMDIGQSNVQWVNNGAGVWCVDAENVYAWVDATLLGGFTAQLFGALGSVRIDDIPVQKGTSILDLADTPSLFYYDGADRKLWLTLPNFDEPLLHSIFIGVTYALCQYGFEPVSGFYPIDGRLLNAPTFTRRRDPLFFGRAVFPSTTLEIANADGEYDSWGDSIDIYGNDVRILLGFEDLTYTDFLTIYNGYVDTITVGEDALSVTVADKRKQLTKPITYSCTNLNALEAIEEILAESYGYTYDTTFYDTGAWETARANVENVTIDMREPDATIDVIEEIAASVFGQFSVDADNLFTFKVIDEDDSITAMIPREDVLTPHSITYSPAEVISSVRVGYARDWGATGASAYTWYTDVSRESEVFALYKTYNQRTFETVLPSLSAATAFATRVLDYSDRVRGTEEVTVPLEYYPVDLGHQAGIDVARGTRDMLGEMKAEVIGVEYSFDAPVIRLGLRHGGTVESILITEDSVPIGTEDGAFIVLEV